MKKTLLTLALTASALLAQDCSYADNLSQHQYKAKDLDCIGQMTEKNFANATPLRIDKTTVLTSLKYDKKTNTVINKYTLFQGMQVSTKDWNLTAKEVSKNTTETNCTNPNSKQLLDFGLNAKHIYTDYNTKRQFTVLVNKKICK